MAYYNGKEVLLGTKTVTVVDNITVDDELSITSENPVQNKVISEFLQGMGERMNSAERAIEGWKVDDALSDTSTNPVQNKVVTEAIRQLQESGGGGGANIVVDDHLDRNSTNPVQNKVVTSKIDEIGYTASNITAKVDNYVMPKVTALEEAVEELQTSMSEDLGPQMTMLEGRMDYIQTSMDDMQPVRFTVEKTGSKYVSSKTHQELLDILAENEHRSIICEVNGFSAPLVSVTKNNVLIFTTTISIWNSITVQISDNGGATGVSVYQENHSIEINGQVWDEDEPNSDFTDTINEMIDDKVGSKITTLEKDVEELKENGGGADDVLDIESENPIQNKAVTKAINLMGKLVGSDEPGEVVKSKNLFNPVNKGWVVNWYNPLNDGLAEGGSYTTSDYIEVKAGKYAVSVKGNATTPGSLSSAPRYVLYDADKHAIRGKQKENPIEITANDIADGGTYIRVSVITADNIQVEEGATPTAYEPYIEPTESEVAEPAFYLNRDPIGYFRASGNLADGEELTLPENNVRTNTVIVFTCHIGTMNKLIIGEKDGSAPYLIIDNTNVEIHGTSSDTDTKPHGLTFGDNLLVRIESGTDLNAKRITVASGSSTFELTSNIKWSGDRKGAYVCSDGSTLTNCVLSWTCRNIAKPVWVFGDSYVSHGYSQRWPYHLYADGYGDALMLNGYAGEKSADALTSLKNLLKIGRPQYIVWAMGMNDKDGTSAANSAWKSCFDEVVALCEQMNITLIACTIPQTPTTTTNNKYKNAIIRASGLRYIDFEVAVVKNTTTGEWYAGMRADEETNENCHPSTSGAKALYYRLLCDFPEIMTL